VGKSCGHVVLGWILNALGDRYVFVVAGCNLGLDPLGVEQ
jgi:hypothetical protein